MTFTGNPSEATIIDRVTGHQIGLVRQIMFYAHPGGEMRKILAFVENKADIWLLRELQNDYGFKVRVEGRVYDTKNGAKATKRTTGYGERK